MAFSASFKAKDEKVRSTRCFLLRFITRLLTPKVLGGTPPLSKGERKIAKEAAELGFNIVQPLIVFLEDWNVKVELKGSM